MKDDELLGKGSDNQTDAKTRRVVLLENNSRIEMESKISFLPNEIKAGLDNKRLQFADTHFYIVKDISLKSTIDVFQGTDNKSVALGNVANQKLEKDNWFLLSAIRLLYAVSPTGKEKANFSLPPEFILNGEWELEAGQKKLIGLMGTEAFDTTNTHKQTGLFKFDSVKVIEPQVEIKMPMKFALPAPADAWLKVVFIGQSVIPY